MPTYPDRRSRYSNVFLWEAANVSSSTPAVRGSAPRDFFRVVTAEPPAHPQTEWIQNEKGEWVKEVVQPTPQTTDTAQTQGQKLLDSAGQRPLAGSESLSGATEEMVKP